MRRIAATAILLIAGVSNPLAGQTRQVSSILNAGDVAGPTYLTATMTNYGAWLRFPAVPNATGYNVTRVSYQGQPEILISSRASNNYAFEGNACTLGNAQPTCVYFDNQFRTSATKLTVTYRVYAIVPGTTGPMTTHPSPPASVLWNCPDCPKLP